MTYKYPSLDKFPPAASADAKSKYLACDTGMIYYVSTVGTPTYKELWPSSASPVDYQAPGFIGSNRTLQDTVHVRS